MNLMLLSHSQGKLPTKRIRKRKLHDDTPWALLMLAPNIIGFFMFMVFPILATLFYSFTEYDLIGAPTFVGLANYVELFNDKIIATTVAPQIT